MVSKWSRYEYDMHVGNFKATITQADSSLRKFGSAKIGQKF